MVDPALAPDAEPRTAPPVPRDARATVAVVLVVLGLLLIAVYRLGVSSERHSFASGATPPSTFSLKAGDEYSLGIPGGVEQTQKLLPDPSAISCTITSDDGSRRQLAIAAEPITSKAIHQIGRFVAPTTERAAIECAGLPAVFVDDAEDAGFDWAGFCLLLASACLVVGLPLLFSVLRRHVAAGREPYPTA